MIDSMRQQPKPPMFVSIVRGTGRDAVEIPVEKLIYAGRDRDGVDWWTPITQQWIEPTDRLTAGRWPAGKAISGFEVPA